MKRLANPWFWLLLLCIAGVSALAAQRVAQSSQPIPTEERPPLLVSVVPAKVGEIRQWVLGEGTARAARREFLSFERGGKVVFIGKDIQGRELRAGSKVLGPKKGERLGQLLAQLDQRENVETLKRKDAALEQAQQNLAAAQSAREKARTDLDLAQTEFKRMLTLKKRGVVSGQKFDKAQADFSNAKSALGNAEAQLQAAQARIDAAGADLNRNKLELERTALFAPFDGVVTYLNIRMNDRFQPGFVDKSSEQRMVETTPIVVIDPSVFEITLNLPLFDGMLVQEGQPALVSLAGAARPGATEKEKTRPAQTPAMVYSVSPAITPGGRTVQVKLRTVETQNNLQDGMFVAAWIVVKEKDQAVLAPDNVFVYRKNIPYVFVLDKASGVVQRRRVELGLEGVGATEIRSGVKAGELMVTDGRYRLVDGAKAEAAAVAESPEAK